MITALVFMEIMVGFSAMANVIIPWCIAEIIRFSYYQFGDNKILKFLRYNAFLVLYPVGIFGELRCVNYWITENPSESTAIIFSRLYQVALVGL